jgi:hypothetical protein
VIVEYALRDSSKPMGVAQHRLSPALPPRLQHEVPTPREFPLMSVVMTHPFLGSRRMAKMLSTPGGRTNRKRTRRQMGLPALGPKRNTSEPAPGHRKYP